MKGEIIAMLNHIVLMTFKDELSESDRRIAGVKLKSGLENLEDKVDGLLEIHVENILTEDSTADLLLTCKFTDERGLQNLKTTPLMFDIKPVIDSSLGRIHTASYHV